MNKILNVIALCVNYVEFGDQKINDVPKNELNDSDPLYLHGDLENNVGFDLAVATNCATLGIKKFNPVYGHDTICLNDIVDVSIDGINKECVGYFWTVPERKNGVDGWRQRGLICFKDDQSAIESAKLSYKQHSTRI